MSTHIVLRPISGTPHKVGTEVDATDWKHTQKLVDQRYLKPITMQAPGGNKPAGSQATNRDQRGK